MRKINVAWNRSIEERLAKTTKGGVIMDVVNAEQAIIAEKSGAVSVP